MRYSRPVISKVEGENPWVTYIKALVFEKNKCLNCVTIGESGSGKSWATLKLVSDIEPDFELDGNWFFKASPFMKHIRDYYKDLHRKKGKIWVLDEAGVDLYNLNYMDAINKGLNAFFQTARHRNYIFFGTVPYVSFLSKGVRSLMTAQMTAQGYTPDNKTILYPRVIQYNPEIDRDFKKMLLVKEGVSLKKCTKMLMPKPPIRLIREYEKLKNEFTSDLFGGIADKIAAWEQKKVEKAMGGKLTPDQESVLNLLKEKHNVAEIAKMKDTTERNIQVMMTRMKSKGIRFGRIGNKKGNTVSHYVVIDPREKASRRL